jgi:plastocyanin
MKKILSAASLGILLLFAVSCSKDSGSSITPPPVGGTASVSIVSTSAGFSPASLTVSSGTVVTWTNNDASTTHTVTSNDGTSFNSGGLANGMSFSYTANAPGKFAYHCSIHPSMVGTLIVTP